MTRQNLSLGMCTTLNSNRKKDTWAQLHMELTRQATLCSLMAFLGKSFIFNLAVIRSVVLTLHEVYYLSFFSRAAIGPRDSCSARGLFFVLSVTGPKLQLGQMWNHATCVLKIHSFVACAVEMNLA